MSFFTNALISFSRFTDAEYGEDIFLRRSLNCKALIYVFWILTSSMQPLSPKNHYKTETRKSLKEMALNDVPYAIFDGLDKNRKIDH